MRLGVFHERRLPDGRMLDVYPLYGDRARVCLGPPGAPWYDDAW